MTAAAVGLLVAVASWLLLAPPRPPRRARAGRVRRPAWRDRRRPGRPAEVDLGVLVTEVATRLRTGAPVERAWAETLARSGLSAREPTRTGVLGEGGVPLPLERLAAGGAGRAGRSRSGRSRARDGPRLGAAAIAALPGALAACRLTHELGAPLAQVLERCAQGLTEAGHARAARAVALAGPRATARLLGWLPLVGLALGAAVGADPVAVLLDGRLGTACLVAGAALVVAGRRWVRALERAASAAADAGAP
ncbi:type II secretion system F family protein [Georgenia ruanii]|uniref:type II secretion system F family protein n=1 Tax=Georgenia ruanii TaxID=348442 RepID=UPI001D021D18|nr:type II secretion protein F [Georgenia ruanii]